MRPVEETADELVRKLSSSATFVGIRSGRVEIDIKTYFTLMGLLLYLSDRTREEEDE